MDATGGPCPMNEVGSPEVQRDYVSPLSPSPAENLRKPCAFLGFALSRCHDRQGGPQANARSQTRMGPQLVVAVPEGHGEHPPQSVEA